MDASIENYYDITLKAVADTVTQLLKYPFGFHGDTGIRDYLYARLHVLGGRELEVDDPRSGYSTLLLQSEHYTTFRYKNKGKDGKRARFDLALAWPPKPGDLIEKRCAEKLAAAFAFELGKNKTQVIDPAMFDYGTDSHPKTTDISKLFLDLKHCDKLRQGWAIEFYDSRQLGGVSSANIIRSALHKLQQVNLKPSKKLVVVFVVYSPDGQHHVSSNNADVELSLIRSLAEADIQATSNLSPIPNTSAAQNLGVISKKRPNAADSDKLFVRSQNIVIYKGKACHLSCRRFSFALRQVQNGEIVEIDRGKDDEAKFLALKDQIQIISKAPDKPITDEAFWIPYLKSVEEAHGHGINSGKSELEI